jgi:hypothetical protein
MICERVHFFSETREPPHLKLSLKSWRTQNIRAGTASTVSLSLEVSRRGETYCEPDILFYAESAIEFASNLLLHQRLNAGLSKI